METNGKSFIKILREYFETKSPDEILLLDQETKEIVLLPEWFYGKGDGPTITPEKFQRYLASVLIQKENDNYYDSFIEKGLVESAIAKRRNLIATEGMSKFISPEESELSDEEKEERTAYLDSEVKSKVSAIGISFRKNISGETGALFTVYGLRAGHYRTKEVVCENDVLEHRAYQLTEDEFIRRIAMGLQSDPTNPKKTTMSEEAIQFATPTIKNSLIQMAENLTQYYDYLIEAKREHSLIVLSQEQHSDERPFRERVKPSNQIERVNNYIPLEDREKALKESGLIFKVDIHGAERANGTVSPDYHVYTTNPKNNKNIQQVGQLFWFEPVEGNHEIRIIYCSPERMKKILNEDKKVSSEDKEINGDSLTDAQITSIVSYFYSLSNDEIKEEPNVKIGRHTTMQAFKQLAQVGVDFGLSTLRRAGKLYGINDLKRIAPYTTLEEQDCIGTWLGNIHTNDRGDRINGGN